MIWLTGILEVNERYEPVHEATLAGLSGFLNEITAMLEEVDMTIKTAKEETGSGKVWIALVSSTVVLANLQLTE